MKVQLFNSVGGLLDERVVETEEEARDAAMEIIAGMANLAEGDRLVVGG